MSRRRAGISAGQSDLSWAARRMRVADVVPSGPAPSVPDPAARIRHAVIRPQHGTWYRVMRAYRGTEAIGPVTSHGLWYECIGEFPTALEAMTFARSEAGCAIVNDWHSKPYYRNGQPVEDRP